MSTDGKIQASQRLAIGTNPGRNRAHNRRVVLEVIRFHGQLGRTEIARHAKISPQAVANIVDELVADGLLIEMGRLRSGRGQPPIQFAVNPNGPMTVGIEVAAGHMVTVFLDLSGTVRGQSVITLPDDARDPVSVAQLAASEVARLRRQHKIALKKLLGIGIAMPGPFGIEGMSSIGPATLPGWDKADPKRLFSEALGSAVVVENDATAAVVGERLYGAGRQLSNFCYLYFGIGLGLGIIQDGRPLRGAFGNAGEIGHISLAPRHGTGTHGPDGALERFASVLALRKHLAEAGVVVTTSEEIEALLHQLHPALLNWIAMAADYLAPTVGLLENIFDPETVIFGGGLPDPVLDAVIGAMEPLPISVSTRAERALPRVTRGQTGSLTAALGAAALPVLDTVSPHLNLAGTDAAP